LGLIPGEARNKSKLHYPLWRHCIWHVCRPWRRYFDEGGSLSIYRSTRM